MSTSGKGSEIAAAVRIRVRKSRLGRCYELALAGVTRCKYATLVHGSVINSLGTPMGHAWIEIKGMVYDPVLDRVFHTGEFSFAAGAVVYARYSYREAARKVVETNHWGPWHNARREATADRRRLTVAPHSVGGPAQHRVEV